MVFLKNCSLIVKTNKIILGLSYKFITNFPPLFYKINFSNYYLKNFKKILYKNIKYQTIKQFCKSFLTFICLCQYFYKNKNNNNVFIKLFILPKQIVTISCLQAPFVHKLAKKHYFLKRHSLIIAIKYIRKEKKLSLSDVFCSLTILVHISLFFESNLCYNNKIIITYSFFLN